jgi:proteasome component ECM29
MASEQTPEAKELALVGKVEMRIALASSEKKLEDLLKTYLTPLLLKLGSDSVAVRNKVGSSSGGSIFRPLIPIAADSGFSF